MNSSISGSLVVIRRLCAWNQSAFWCPACWCCCDSSKLSVVPSIFAKKQVVALSARAVNEMALQCVHWMCGKLESSSGPWDVHMDWLNGEEPNIQEYPLKGALAVTVHLSVPKKHGIVVSLRGVIGLVSCNSATNSTITGRFPDFKNFLIRY